MDTQNKHVKQLMGNGRQLFSFYNVLLVFFVAIMGGLISLASTFAHNNRNFSRSTYWVKHTHEVIAEALQLSSQMKELQLENSNFLLTGDAPASELYMQSRTLVTASTARLSALTRDNPSQEAQVATLQQHVDALIRFGDTSMRGRTMHRYSDEALIDAARTRKQMRDVINGDIDRIRREELRLLKVRETVNAEDVYARNRFLYTSLIVIFVLLSGSFSLTVYHSQKRRKAEELMRESEERFRTLVNSIKDFAIYMTDENGIITNWYPGAAKVKGYTNEEVIGRPVALFHTPEAIAAGEPDHILKTAAENGSFEAEGWRVRKDGSRFWADVFISALYDEGKQLQGFTIVARDYSMHKKAEDEIRRALETEKELNEMKSNFVSIASHEFRTPLSTILSSISLLEQYRTTETQDKRDRHIQRIKFSVRELVSILDEFLSLEKIEEGKVHAKRRLINIGDMIQQVGSDFQSVLKPGQHIEYRFDGEREVYLDPSFVQHMLTNLISNASKYSDCDMPIEVSAYVADSKIELSVKDYGIGISHADQASLFGRFYRASNAGTVQGTGLGLHIVKRYVELMGGIIQVKSDLGQGSEFVITLPRLVTAEVHS